jgi:3-hydroxyisobutyrate dehydrogenase-like beta-hydroxyacid dehydrogenase
MHPCDRRHKPADDLFEREAEDEVLPYCLWHNIATLVYGSFCRGPLRGRMRLNTHFGGDDQRSTDPKFLPPRFGEYLRAVNQLDSFARDNFGKRVMHPALRWVLDQPGVSVSLMGARQPAQLEPLSEVMGWKLSNDAMAEIDRIVRTNVIDPIGPEFMAPPSAAQGNIIIEMSTISPETSRELSRMGKARGLEVLDVAISGGPPVAEQGALTLLAGGSESAFNNCAPIFSAIAKQYFLLGPSGSGTSMKLVVNAIMGVSMQAIALGEKLVLPRDRLLKVLSQTAVVAPAQQNKLIRAAVNDYSAQFLISLMNKDFHLVVTGSGDRSADADHLGGVPDERRAGRKAT